MRAHRITFLVLFVCRLGALAFAREPEHAFSIPEYISELDHLATLAQQALTSQSAADRALEELSGEWKVKGNQEEFTFGNSWLIDQFERLRRNPDPRLQDELIERLNALKRDAQQFQQTPADSASAHRKLNEILERREFHQVRGPTWIDRLKYRILMWIIRVLSRVFGSSSVPVVGRALVWALVGVAVLVLAMLVYRAIKQSAHIESVIPQVAPVSAKNWRVWIEEAQAAAAKGLWREAVHLAYWAGVSFLEQNGMWKPDKARTPREYLRLVPPGSAQYAPFANLTRRLELTWYGNQPAGPGTFSETVRLLENLGCREA